MGRLTLEKLRDASLQILARQPSGSDSQAKTQHSFRESVELQVALKGYDVQKDRRFCGSVHLPHMVRPALSVCLIACDAEDIAKADSAGVRHITVTEMRAWNRNKKLVKRFASSADHFICSSAFLKQVPRLVGPWLVRAGKFPVPLARDEDLAMKIMECQCKVQFRLKRELTLGTCVGHVDMLPAELLTNCLVAVNFLVSLLKRNWWNVKSLHLKTTMGKPIRLC
mmetsp:Transcript_6153/g.13646  ORF Transcript_6153/g.13646 Transcript_6153/m.13646 type:complete len:225 (+) Transcript_6153:151-825(+)